MPRPDGRIEPGQPLRGAISARAWNRAQDAADVVLGAYAGTEGVQGSPVLKPYTWCYCQPSGGVNRWGVLAITGLAIVPSGATATASFEDMPVLTAEAPTQTHQAWCIAVEPIESGKVGRVAVGGVVQCRINVNNAKDKFVSCLGSGLSSGYNGEGQILWKDSGTGQKWALVRLASGAQGIVRGTFNGGWDKNGENTVTAYSTGTVFDRVKNYCTAITGAGTKDCSIAYIADEWVLIDFDLKQLDGFNEANTQVLSSVSGNLKWLDTKTC